MKTPKDNRIAANLAAHGIKNVEVVNKINEALPPRSKHRVTQSKFNMYTCAQGRGLNRPMFDMAVRVTDAVNEILAERKIKRRYKVLDHFPGLSLTEDQRRAVA